MKGKNLSRGLSKILSVLLSLVLIFGALPITAFAYDSYSTFEDASSSGFSSTTFAIVDNGSKNALSYSSGLGITAVTVSGNYITDGSTSSIVWTASGSSNFTLKNGSNYLRISGSSLTTTTQSYFASQFSYSNSHLSSGSSYISYSGSAFGVTTSSSSAAAIVPYKERTVSSIAVTTQPTTADYAEGDTFNPAGMVVTATFSSGSPNTAAVTGYSYSTSSLVASGATQSQQITWCNKQSSATISVTDKPTMTTQPGNQTISIGQTASFSAAASAVNGSLGYQWYSGASSSGPFSAIGGATNASYTTPVINTSGTTYYMCRVTNTLNGVTVSTDSNSVSLIVNAPLTGITATGPSNNVYADNQPFDPRDMVVTAHYSGGSSAAVTGYTWTPTGDLTVTTTSVTIHYGSPDQTTTVNVVVNPQAPSITGPSDLTENVGQNGVLTASASRTDGGTLSYQWFDNGTNNSTSGGTLIGSATDASYQPSSAVVGIKYYYCVVANTVGSKSATATSRAAKVDVQSNAEAPNISASTPADVTVGQNIAASLTVSASVSRGTLSYQWYSNMSNSNSGGTNLGSSYRNATMTLNTSTIGTKYYYCIVTNTDNEASNNKTATSTSRAATVIVNALTNAATPTINPDTPVGWLAVDIGATASLSVTASVSKGVLTYQWYSNTTNLNSGGTAVGSSSSDPLLTLNTAAAGTTFYYCVVTNTDTTATGSQTATATSNVAQVIVRRDAQTPNIVSTSPANMSVYQNSSSSITVAAYIDSGALTYQWYSDTTGLNSGGTAVGTLSASPTLTLNTSTAGTNYYYCVVTNTDNDAPGIKTATATSRAARVIVNAATSGTVLFTFDDGWADLYTQAYPILDAKGFKGTAYVNSDFINGHEAGIMTLDQAKDLYGHNWDIANHTTNHEDVGVGDQTDEAHMEQLKAMYCDCAKWLSDNGMSRAAYHVAYPSGLYTTDLIRLLKLNGFKTGRATTFGQQYAIQDQNDYFMLPVYSLGDTNDLTACINGIDEAANTGTTIIIMIHKVEPRSGDLVTLTSWLQQVVNEAKSKVDAHKLQVMTISDWYNAQGVVGSGQTPPAPKLTRNDDTNTVTGLNMVMEYKLDNAANYTMYDPTTFASVHLAGDHTLAVRYAAAGADPAGPDTVLTFTKVLKSISITKPPTKTVYSEGTTFDATDMVVTATYDDGTSGAVTGYTIDPAGALATTNKKVTVSYTLAGITKTAEQSITVNTKKLASISITAEPTKKTYIEGTLFDPAGMTVSAIYDNDTSEAITGYTTAPTGELKTSDTKVIVSYTYVGVTKTIDQLITVDPKSLLSIGITTPPNKTTYIEGNTFVSAGMAVTAYYDNGKNEVVTGYTIAPSDALTTTDKKVTVSYSYMGVSMTADQPIKVNEKSLDHIKITTEPFMKTYVEGSPFSSTGMVVTAYYDNGTYENVYGYSVAPLRALTTADTTVTVSYTYAGVMKTVDQQIMVHAKALTRIEITTAPLNTTYVVGNTFNTAGMVVTAFYDNDTSAVVTGYSYDPTGALTASDVKVTVSYTYLGITKTAEQKIMVLIASLDQIAITTPPDNSTYIEGNTFDKTGMVVTAYYNNGTSGAVTGYSISPSGELATTDTKVTVSYGGKTAEQPIMVNAKKLTSIAITTQPNNKTYIEGNTFDPTGMAVTAYYDNGKNEVVTGYTVAPSGALAMTDTKITVSYTLAGVTMTAEQKITVNAKSLTSIAITTPPNNKTYIEGNTFDTTGMVVTAYYDNGKNEAVKGYSIVPSGALAMTDTKVTVSYTSAGVTKTADQAITVALKSLNHIEITTEPTKKVYIEGNTFDPSGMVVTAHYDNGTSGVVTGYSIAPSGALATTDTKVTVNYGGKTADQVITVIAKAITGLDFKTHPTKVNYIEGQTFDPTGMVLTATYNDGSSKDVLPGDCAFSINRQLQVADTSIVITFDAKNVTQDVIVSHTYASNQLKDITASAGTLSPVFDPDIKSYTLLLDEYTAKTTIVPVLADASSKLFINGKKASSKTFTLANAKKTKVTIKVQPKTGKAVTYTVTIQRAASTNTSLAYLKASKGSLTKVDSANCIVNLSNTQTKTAFSLKLADKTAKNTMMLDGKKTKNKTVALQPGQTRTLIITVTPQAGSAYAVTYTVTIIRALS